jgi:hypothetical protein
LVILTYLLLLSKYFAFERLHSTFDLGSQELFDLVLDQQQIELLPYSRMVLCFCSLQQLCDNVIFLLMLIVFCQWHLSVTASKSLIWVLLFLHHRLVLEVSDFHIELRFEVLDHVTDFVVCLSTCVGCCRVNKFSNSTLVASCICSSVISALSAIHVLWLTSFGSSAQQLLVDW